MAFNPLEHRGMPWDKQLRNWRELDVAPIDPDNADPYTRCRIIAMNGIEVEALMFSHHLNRVCPDGPRSATTATRWTTCASPTTS
ncbi:hypothetical protein GCM10022221_66090 [Actinocorallia aurea]